MILLTRILLTQSSFRFYWLSVCEDLNVNARSYKLYETAFLHFLELLAKFSKRQKVR